MFGFLSKKKALNNVGHKLFVSVIDQSRLAWFYSELAVEDNLDGRFDLMSLHMAMVLQKLDQNKQNTDAAKLKQVVQEIMFDNLDLTLREIGVGDLGVGKKIKVMAEAFYGRMMVYQDLFNVKDKQKMSIALQRNLYRERKMAQDILPAMTKYVYHQVGLIESQNMESFMTGEVNFLAPTGIKND
jgi:cytochrome b pre-mRNA-processing protein 3|tara:strand:+ start:53893 stop:54447 length:555 start_codon:yes stop_codon:yes gene_type:complete